MCFRPLRSREEEAVFWSPETNHSPNMQNAARKQNKRERKKAEYPKSGNNCEVRDLECFIFSNAS